MLINHGKQILEVDWNGEIVNSWHARTPAGTVPLISDAKIIVS